MLLENAAENLMIAKEILWDAYNNPAGSLWNLGTTPTALDRAEWKARKELAEELLSILDRKALIEHTRKYGV